MAKRCVEMKRLLAGCALAGLMALPASSDTGSTAFGEVNYAPVSSGEIARTATVAPARLEGIVQRTAANFSRIPTPEGALLLPEGTTCDSVEIVDGVMTVRFTLPASIPAEGLPAGIEDNIHAVLRGNFAEAADLRETRIFARQGSGEYTPFVEWVDLPDAPSPDADDWFEPDGPGPQPAETSPESPEAGTSAIPGQTPLTGSGQPQGALSGRTVYFYGGHGRIWRHDVTVPIEPRWDWQRGVSLSMNEDTANWDQQEFFAHYLFNAGATVVAFRPIGNQANEVVLDNTSAAVTWSGTWTNSTSTRYYGPGSPPYRWASTVTAPAETATATYTPNIPSAGFYPVYTWVNFGSDRVNQLYRIRHTGGEAQVRVNHRRVGCGWVWLGTYRFNSGSNSANGSVVISNQEVSGDTGSVVIADAIRFGNGMGDVDRGGGVSGLRREEESTRYWIQRSVGVPDDPGIYNAGGYSETGANANQADESDSWAGPPLMAAAMRRDDGQGTSGDIYLGFHSNANDGTARGCVGLYSTSNPTPNQAAYATLVADELDADCLAEDTPGHWPYTWYDRASATYGGGYSEISNGNIGGEMDATIIEVAFHDNLQDSTLLRDPRCRNVIGRACYQAIVRYFNTYDGLALNLLPEPPVRARAVNNGSGGVTVSWQPGPSGGAGGDAATSYVVYRSTDGYGFGNPVTTASTSTTITGLTAGQTYYFRVAARNAGGESFPTESLAVRVRNAGGTPILIVNGYDRCDLYNNVLNDLPAMAADRIRLRHNNSYDYVMQHAQAIAAFERDFDSCANEAVENSDISLGSYHTVVWILGEEADNDDTFSATERTRVQTYLTGGGHLFVSGSEIGYELDSLGVAPSFYNSTLRADFAGDDANTHSASGSAGSIFSGIASLTFDDGTTVYDVDSPDVLATSGGSVAALDYSGGGSGTTQLDSMDSVANWWDPNDSGSTTADAACTFTLSTSTKHEGTGAGDLYYVWGTGSLIREHNNLQPSFPDTQRITMWVYGDNSGNTVRISVRDSDGDLWMGPAMTVNFTGWQQYIWDNPNTSHTYWATVGNGTYDAGTVRLESIRVDKGGSSPASGHLYFDDFVYGTPTGSPVAAIQYPAGSTGTLVMLGFPFEAITSSTVRNQVMAAALTFFTTPVPAELSVFSAD